jgi:hypothetical protein
VALIVVFCYIISGEIDVFALQKNTNIWFEGVQVCTNGWNAMPALTSRNSKNILKYVLAKNIRSRLKIITVNLSSSWGVMLGHLAI